MGIFRQFPYSNFHEMNMDEILKIVKNMVEEWNATKEEWNSYKEFIDNYFTNLDVTEEVLNAMRVFANDGTLNQIIDPTIASEVSDWLSEHITLPEGVVIDDTLTIEGACADAKATGIGITNNAIDLALLLEHIEPDTVENNKYYTMSGGIVNSYNVTGSSTNIYDVTSLRNKTVYISAIRNPGAYTAYVMIAGENNNYLDSIIDASNRVNNRAITIPAEAKYLYLNYHTVDKIGKVTVDNNAKNILSKFTKAFLWSASPIYWNWQNGKVQSKTAISIYIPSENYNSVLATPVDDLAEISCGTSRFLYYDKSNNTLVTNGSIIANSNTMLLIGACQAHELDYLTLQKGCTKKCACFGDSITYYDGHPYNWGKFSGEIAIGYETWLRRIFGFVIYNYGSSGETAIQICNRVRLGDFSTMDYLILTSGANDERHNTPLGVVLDAGSNFDVNTFCGAFQSAIESALTDNPELKIVLCTPIQGWIYSSGYDENDYPDHPVSGDIDPKWSNAIKRIAEIYSLPVCDWYGESGINLLTRNEYINDPEPPENVLYSLHPTAKGFERMSEILVGVLNKIMPL